MSMHPGLVLAALDEVRNQTHSAMPDAPVVPHEPPAPARPRLRRTRAATAAVLFHAASRVSPA